LPYEPHLYNYYKDIIPSTNINCKYNFSKIPLKSIFLCEIYNIKQRGVEIMKKILAIVLTLSMLISVPVFADTSSTTQTPATEQTTTAEPTSDTTTTDATETTTAADEAATTETAEGSIVTTVSTTADAGITPDSAFYALDKLIEEIQLALITDTVKEAEALAEIAQERLAESNEMADKEDVELTQKALDEYKVKLEKAVELIEAAMEEGKAVAEVMEDINDANLNDAAVVEKILESIPEEFRDEVKAEIEEIAAAAEAANDTAQVIENEEEEENSVKLEITLKLIEEMVDDSALVAKITEAGLNTRQITALISLSEQSEKPLAEVIDLFIANENGIGATVKELGLNTKDALKGINGSFKDTKATIKNAFKEAIKVVEEEEQEEVEEVVANSITAPTTTTEEVKAVKEKLEKVVKEAKEQVEAIAAEKEVEKAEKVLEKATEKVEKVLEKATEKAEKALEQEKKDAEKAVKDADDDNDDNDDDEEEEVEDEDEDDDKEDSVKDSKGKSNKKN
jgi:hypothetical protein